MGRTVCNSRVASTQIQKTGGDPTALSDQFAMKVFANHRFRMNHLYIFRIRINCVEGKGLCEACDFQSASHFTTPICAYSIYSFHAQDSSDNFRENTWVRNTRSVTCRADRCKHRLDTGHHAPLRPRSR